MIALASFALAGCLAVGTGSDYILAKDLAPAFPALAEVAPDTPLVPAPMPGAPRIFRVPELGRLSVRFNVTPAPEGEICIQRPVAVPDRARILEAMQQQLPEARIDILDISRQPAPEGPFEFPLSGLRQGITGGYWNGFVRYGSNHRFAVWAKVKVLVTAARVVAAVELKPGRPIDNAQLRLETREEAPGADAYALTIEDVAGRVPRRTIAAGAAIRLPWTEAAKDVLSGDTVSVEVTNGGAHLEFEAQAQASGSAGQIIPVLNPVSNKRFPARVQGKGKVSVVGTSSVKGTP
ncbi:MAG TPA: flagellar basal body P-ring formation chaperone FlgA [Candidatus Acidoferrales bacterium]|jgi:flagella basal body P-ring formation protein FlgA|nr:flagellar basal body P-ring formation chaperone FlgA [Candidatus Acidoferrales bacterium]